MAAEITVTRYTAMSRRPGVWIGLGIYAVVLVVVGLVVRHTWWSPLLWLVGGGFVGLWIVSRAARKALQTLYPPKTEVRVTTEPEGLRFTAAEKGSYLLAWAQVRSVEELRGHLILYRSGPGGPIIVPPALVGPDTVEAATAAVHHPPPVP